MICTIHIADNGQEINGVPQSYPLTPIKNNNNPAKAYNKENLRSLCSKRYFTIVNIVIFMLLWTRTLAISKSA